MRTRYGKKQLYRLRPPNLPKPDRTGLRSFAPGRFQCSAGSRPPGRLRLVCCGGWAFAVFVRRESEQNHPHKLPKVGETLRSKVFQNRKTKRCSANRCRNSSCSRLLLRRRRCATKRKIRFPPDLLAAV